jgi:hypothetical protein
MTAGELRHQGVDAGHDLIAAGHGQRAAGAEIVLDVDDEQGVGRVAHELASGGGHDCPPYGLRERAQPCRGSPMLIVAALYRFTRFEDPNALRAPLRDVCEADGVKGSLLLAPRGSTGPSRGPGPGSTRCWRISAGCRVAPIWSGRRARPPRCPFGRMKVRLKREIVTMGVPGTDPNALVGTYVAPGDWNDLIAAPDVAVIDTRNDYETAIGTFEGAVDPGTESFRDFPRGGRRTATGSTTSGSRCSAPAASVARNRRPT